MQQPGIQRGAAGLVAVRTCGMGTERQCPPVAACRHVRADDPELRVGRVQHQCRALEGLERRAAAARREKGFTLVEQALSQRQRALALVGIAERQ